MTRFAFTIEYDGRPYMGWQRQAHGATVQQHIEEALGRIVGTVPVVHCAGRTDAASMRWRCAPMPIWTPPSRPSA